MFRLLFCNVHRITSSLCAHGEMRLLFFARGFWLLRLFCQKDKVEMRFYFTQRTQKQNLVPPLRLGENRILKCQNRWLKAMNRRLKAMNRWLKAMNRWIKCQNRWIKAMNRRIKAMNRWLLGNTCCLLATCRWLLGVNRWLL